MNIRELQEQLEKERAILKAAKDRIAIQNAELEELRKSVREVSRSDDAVNDANTRLTELIQNIQSGVFVVDENKAVVILNELFCKLFGIVTAPDQIIGSDGPKLTKQLSQLFKDPIAFISSTEEIVRNKKTVLNEELTLKNGQIYSRDFIPLFTESKYRGYLWKYTDITRNKTIGDTFDAQRRFFEQILNNLPAEVVVCDHEHRYMFANPKAVSNPEHRKWIIGKTNDEFCEYTDRPKSWAENRNNIFNEVKRLKVQQEWEETLTLQDGVTKYYLWRMYPVLSDKGGLEIVIGYGVDITERKKIEDQLTVAKLEADRSSMSKDIFLTNMSHEIRTPLNAIMGLGKLLSKSDLNAVQKNYLNGIESASSNLLGIINDLLDFSKIEAGKISLEEISFSLETIAKQVVSVLMHKAEERGLSIHVDIDQRIAPVVIGDPFRVNQIFMNMVSNAIKFTEKGSVYLKAFMLEHTNEFQKVLVMIEDTGVGIKEEYLENIFDKFTQEDETVVRKFGGTGLGMSITKQLIELMGGTISVFSKKNVGTTISLTFNFRIGTSRVFEKKKTIKNDTANINGKRILLVEDNNLNRLLAYTILTEYGAVILEAENGLQAIERMKNESFDLVLMDIQMPVMDGLQATKIIRDEISKTIPVLALTANAIKGKENQFLEAGMNDFIFKPYNEMNLVTPISKWLGAGDEALQPELEPPQPAPAEIPVVSVASEQYYDLSKLMAMGRNDIEFIKKMLRLFINETPPALNSMVEAYKTGDMASVKYLAHRMKPSINSLGISSLQDDIIKIEAVTERTAANDKMINKLINIINKVIEGLKAEYGL